MLENRRRSESPPRLNLFGELPRRPEFDGRRRLVARPLPNHQADDRGRLARLLHEAIDILVDVVADGFTTPSQDPHTSESAATEFCLL